MWISLPSGSRSSTFQIQNTIPETISTLDSNGHPIFLVCSLLSLCNSVMTKIVITTEHSNFDTADDGPNQQYIYGIVSSITSSPSKLIFKPQMYSFSCCVPIGMNNLHGNPVLVLQDAQVWWLSVCFRLKTGSFITRQSNLTQFYRDKWNWSLERSWQQTF